MIDVRVTYDIHLKVGIMAYFCCVNGLAYTCIDLNTEKTRPFKYFIQKSRVLDERNNYGYLHCDAVR